MSELFSDSKTFVDATPRYASEDLLDHYNTQSQKADFSLKTFVVNHYDLPDEPSVFESSIEGGVIPHIERLWPILTKDPNISSICESNTLINLPHPYIVPGGRFRELYYWDSYFTMLGLRVAGRWDLVTYMVDNFAYLIETFGYNPNGNRCYFLGRSQPPFFSLMVDLLAEHQGDCCYINYLPHLQKEYDFWQQGSEKLSEDNIAVQRVVRMPNGVVLNRYWDEKNTPRPESYQEDFNLMTQYKDASERYRHIRAAAESGWDFSSRWFKDQYSISKIETTHIIPIDLNVLLMHLTRTLSKSYAAAGDNGLMEKYKHASDQRSMAIERYCWDDANGFYRDMNFLTQTQTSVLSLAGMYPLFFQIASEHQACRIADVLETRFLQEGGLTSTLIKSGQQWDAPNGWAPMQWLAVEGLYHYGHTKLANKIKNRWVKLNIDVFNRTGKLLEKYNVYDKKLEGGGGEYPLQDGFGWTNGVLLDFLHEH